MDLLEDTGLLLDLLREAGDEAVTLDELEIVGVREPARALFELELAGHAVSRVFDQPRPGHPVTCVRLAPPAPAPAAALSRAAPAPPAAGPRLALGALVALLVLAAAHRR
jgi:hypothetical protein